MNFIIFSFTPIPSPAIVKSAPKSRNIAIGSVVDVNN